MVFVRTKTIKGKKYAYLVENIWTPAGPRQRSKDYLGRVYDFRRESDILFSEYFKDYDYNNRSKKEILQDTIRLELNNHGFKKDLAGIWAKDDCYVDVKSLKFCNKRDKRITLSLNQGILCKPLIMRVIQHKIYANEEKPEQEGYSLAKLLVECGLKVSHEVFISLYELSK